MPVYAGFSGRKGRGRAGSAGFSIGMREEPDGEC